MNKTLLVKISDGQFPIVTNQLARVMHQGQSMLCQVASIDLETQKAVVIIKGHSRIVVDFQDISPLNIYLQFKNHTVACYPFVQKTKYTMSFELIYDYVESGPFDSVSVVTDDKTGQYKVNKTNNVLKYSIRKT